MSTLLNSTVTDVTPDTSTGGTVIILCMTGINAHQYQIPSEFKLYQNYPNPFNPSTKIKFQTPPYEGGKGDESSNRIVTLKIYDILGREVAALVNKKLQPGTYEVEWNASGYPSGVYFYKMEIRDPETSSGFYFLETKRMVLLK